MVADEMNIAEFLLTVDCEGLAYALTGYYSRRDLEGLPEGRTRTLALAARDALAALEAHIEAPSENLLEAARAEYYEPPELRGGW